eukprot:273243-Hanusia_phi.AAC.2
MAAAPSDEEAAVGAAGWLGGGATCEPPTDACLRHHVAREAAGIRREGDDGEGGRSGKEEMEEMKM